MNKSKNMNGNSKQNSNSKQRGKKQRSKRNYNQNSNDNYNYGYNADAKVTPNIITDGSRDNDPQWYMHLDKVAKDYASLPFSQVLGLTTPNVTRPGATSATGATVTAAQDALMEPGILAMYFIPTIGMNSSGPTAAVNLAAQELYTLVRKANSGRVNYDKTDLMMLIMAMDSAYMVYEDMLRAYRVMSTYNSVNRYYPNGILTALGYDVSLVNHMSEFRGLLDMFAYKLASVNIPDQMDIIKRHSWMCSNIYLDDDNIKAQSYVFLPKLIYIWTEGSGDTPTHLTATTIHGSNTSVPYTLDKLADLVNTIMNPILGSEDVGIMTGDMAKAFSDAGMIKIRPVEDYAALVPVYSQEVILQIRNIFSSPFSIGPTAGGNLNLDITQVLSNTTAGPYLKQNIYAAYTPEGDRRRVTSPLLNFINEDTSPENVMVATRLISLAQLQSSSGPQIVIYGTEVIANMYIYYYSNPIGTVATYGFDQDYYIAESTAALTISNTLATLCNIASFNNAPISYLYTNNANGSTLIGNTANVCNYVYLSDEDLTHLHETAVMSLFTVKDYKLND